MEALLDRVQLPVPEPAQRHALGIMRYLGLLFLFDLAVRQTKLGKISRWKSIHAVANIAISALSARDAWRSALDPAAACSGGTYSLHPVRLHMRPFNMLLGLTPSTTLLSPQTPSATPSPHCICKYSSGGKESESRR